MKLTSDIISTGKVIIRKNGKIVFEGGNLIVDAGTEWIADRMLNSNSPVATMGVGNIPVTDAAYIAGVQSTDTTLWQANGNHYALLSGDITSGVGVVSYEGTFDAVTNPADDVNISEAGLFLTGGTMVAKIKVGPIMKQAVDTVIITWFFNFTSV